MSPGRLTVLAGLVLLAAPAFAASEGAHGHAAPSILDLFWPAVNFALYGFLLWKFAWPAVRDGLAERRRVVEREIETAEGAAREARERLEEVQALRAGEEAEAARIRTELREEGERERAQLVEAARRAAERIREDARRLGEYEAVRGAREIRRAVAREAARRAAEALRAGIGEAEEKRFLDEFVTSVSPGDAR